MSRFAGPTRIDCSAQETWQVETDMGHWDKARCLYEEAAALCKLEGKPMLLAHTVRHLGDVHRHAGQTGAAEACYHEAVMHYRKQKNAPDLDVANALRSLAILKEDLDQLAEAKGLWEEARDLYRAVDVQAGVDECCDRLTRL